MTVYLGAHVKIKNRFVLVSFPSEADFYDRDTSDEYQENVKHRNEGAEFTALLAK